MNQAQTSEAIHALRSSAQEIRHLRNQLTAFKAEAWDVHTEVIKQIFSRGQTVSICNAHQADKLAEELERCLPQDNPLKS